jgi:glycosidase
MSEPGANVEGLKLAFTFLLTTRGTPMIYYGDEIAVKGGGDPYNRADFPGGWAEDKHNAFTADGRTRAQENVHAHVRKLLALRRELQSLRRGDTIQLMTTGPTMAYARVAGDSSAVVAINNGDRSQTLQIKLPPKLAVKTSWHDRLANNSVCNAQDGVIGLQLPSRTAALLTPHAPDVASDQPKTGTSLR